MTKYKSERTICNCDMAYWPYNAFLSPDECFISLTMNTAHFCRTCLSLAQDVLHLYTPDMDQLVTTVIAEIFTAQVAHMEATLKSKEFVQDVSRGYCQHSFTKQSSRYFLSTMHINPLIFDSMKIFKIVVFSPLYFSAMLKRDCAKVGICCLALF